MKRNGSLSRRLSELTLIVQAVTTRAKQLARKKSLIENEEDLVHKTSKKMRHRYGEWKVVEPNRLANLVEAFSTRFAGMVLSDNRIMGATLILLSLSV